MTTVAAIKLLTFLESILLALLANREDSTSKTNPVFVRYVLFVAAQSFVELMLVTSSTEGVFLFWKQFDVFMYFAVASLLRFSLMLRGYPWAGGRRVGSAIYGTASVFAILEGLVLHPRRVTPGPWSFSSEYSSNALGIHSIIVVVVTAMALLTLVMLWQCLVHAKDRRSRGQASIFFWSSLILLAVGAPIELHAAFVPSIQLPWSVTATSAYLMVNPILALAVVRYGLLQLSPLSAVSAIMDMMSESVILADQQGTIHYTNEAARALLGGPEQHRAPASLAHLVLRNGQGGAATLGYEELRNNGQGMREHECLLQCPGREPIPVSLSSTVLGTHLWGETGLILTLRDVSERRKVEDLRDGADRIMRHDLRNTLTGIYTLSGTLAADASLDNEQLETIGMIHEGARLLHEQIDSYLYLRSIEDGSFKAPLDRVELAGVLHSVQRNLEPLAATMNVHLAFMVDRQPVDSSSVIQVRGIRAMLFGIFVNLIKNAIEASPFGSEVLVMVKVADPVVVSVHNRGAIPEEIRPRFFSKFATAGKRRGTGIGAYGARMLAEALGCTVAFTTSDELGTEIVVTFPTFVPDPDRTPAPLQMPDHP